MSTLLIVLTSCFPCGFLLRAGQEFGAYLRATGWSERGVVAPTADHGPDEDEREQRDRDGHDPCQQIETFFRRLDEHCGAILFDHGLEDLVVRFTARYVRVEIFLHAPGGFAGAGECAAGVIAESDGIFAAAAHAEDTLAEGFGSRCILCACGRDRAHR